MTRKNVRYLTEYLCFALFLTAAKYAETLSGLACVAVPAVFAALRLKRNALILLPLLLAASVLCDPSAEALICGGSAVAVALLLQAIQYFSRKRLSEPAYMTAAALCAIPYFFFGSHINAAVSAAVSFFTVRAAIAVLRFIDFPHRPSAEEFPSFIIAAWMAGLVLSRLNVGAFSALPPLFIAAGRLLSPSWGALAGAAVSAVAGAAFAGGETVRIAAIYAFSVLVSNKHSRFGGLIGVSVHALSMALGVSELQPFSLIAPGVIAVVSAVIPDRKLAKFSLPVFGELLKRSVINKERADAGKKIAALAGAFEALKEALSRDYEGDPARMAELKHILQSKVCTDCPGRERCMRALGGSEPESALGELLEAAVRNGKASILDATPFLSSVCVRLKKLIDSAGELAEKERGFEREKAETKENKKILIAEVNALSSALKRLSEGVAKPLSYNGEAEKSIVRELAKTNVYAEALVYGNDEVRLTVPENCDRTAVKAVIEKILSAKMQCVGEESRAFCRVSLSYLKQPRYRLAYGERIISAGEFGSGDVHKVFSPGRGKALIVLSDGMGHDSEAAVNASSAVRLIECFAKAGFDAETALECTGKLLAARNKEEFNAVDIALIDTETGTAEIIKQGARESFLLHGEDVEIIECGTLPLGIVDSAPSVDKVRLSPEDFLIMVTDGIVDALGKDGISDILTSKRFVNPDDIAASVMDEYLHSSGNTPPDDGSVVVARLI